jgi:hypothetical protein
MKYHITINSKSAAWFLGEPTDEAPCGDGVVQLRVRKASHSAIHPAGGQPRRKVRNRTPMRPVRAGRERAP